MHTDRGAGPSDGCREDAEGGSREKQYLQTHLEGLPGGGQGAPGQEKVQEAKAQGAAEPKEQRSRRQRVEGRRGMWPGAHTVKSGPGMSTGGQSSSLFF